MELKDSSFTIYPAIDLRRGRVVRLLQGDPARQTIYGEDALEAALGWIGQGATWLHIVNLDAALDEDQVENWLALEKISRAIRDQFPTTGIQYGGGLRRMADIETALQAGVSRVILGTAAVEEPELVIEALEAYGPERVCVAFDARDGLLQVHGWSEKSNRPAVALGSQLQAGGLRHAIYTDIQRDGGKAGINLPETQRFAQLTGLSVIASGGVASLEDVRRVKTAGLCGVIIGRALYDGVLDLEEALRC